MQLIVSKQDSLYLEKLVKNGAQKEVHYVVKNAPFTIQYKIENFDEKSAYNFHKSKIECQLLYDVKPPRPVDYVNKKPMDYVIHSNERGDECTVEFRIKVLTTQLEGSLFLIKATLWNSKDNKKDSIECLSKCVKTVSKPEQVRKKMAMNNKGSKDNNTSSTRKKRTRSDELLETLQGIQEQQNKQMEMMNHMYGFMYNFALMGNCMEYPQFPAPIHSTSDMNQMGIENTFMNNTIQPQNMQYTDQNNNVPDNKDGEVNGTNNNNKDEFEVAFNNLIQSYKKMNPSERPSKMRKLIQESGNDQEMFDIFQNFNSSMLPVNNTLDSCGQYLNLDTCTCSNCPARQELDQLSKLYMEFIQQEDCKV